MNLINNLIIAIDEAELRNDAYSVINSVAFYISIILGILHGVKLKIKSLHVVVTVAAERLLAGYLASLILFIEDGFVSTGRANAVVAFPFVPLIGLIVAKILKISYKKIWDVVMVSPIVMFIGARIACTVAGCCKGYQCNWGTYNAMANDYLFPIQLLESLVSILILVYVFYREKKNGFVPDGMNVPIILISYGVSRFFLEFLHDNEKIIFGLASTQFHCIFMTIIGVVTLIIVQQDKKRTDSSSLRSSE